MIPKKLIDGIRFEVAYDATDPDFEVITFRFPRNSVVSNGAVSDTPPTLLSGRAASDRFNRFLLARTRGYLTSEGIASEETLDQLFEAHSRLAARDAPGPNKLDIGEWADHNADRAIDKLREVAEANPGQIASGVCGAWTICFSTKSADTGRLGNVFSAKVRRSTKERDWRILGQMSARIGAPKESAPATIKTDPNATHYWSWDGAATQEEVEAVADYARKLYAAKKGDA